MNEDTSKSTVLIIVAIIGASATCIAAIIGLGQPIVEKIADIYLSTSTPIPSPTLMAQAGTTSSDTQSEVLPTSTNQPDIPTNTPLPTHTPLSTQPTSKSTVIQESQSQSTPLDVPYLVIVVGVSDQTAFSPQAAETYNHGNGTYFEVESATEAENKLLELYQPNSVVYAVHIPNLRVTSGDPGACWLRVNQVHLLEQYPKGWVVGENV